MITSHNTAVQYLLATREQYVSGGHREALLSKHGGTQDEGSYDRAPRGESMTRGANTSKYARCSRLHYSCVDGGVVAHSLHRHHAFAPLELGTILCLSHNSLGHRYSPVSRNLGVLNVLHPPYLSTSPRVRTRTPCRFEAAPIP